MFRQEVDACAAAAPALAREHEPIDALAKWLERYTHFIATKRGLAAALHSGDPAFAALPVYFREHLEPVVRSLLEAAADAGQIRSDVDAYDLLRAGANLSVADVAHTQRMVALLVDGLRYGAHGRRPAGVRSGASPRDPSRRDRVRPA